MADNVKSRAVGVDCGTFFFQTAEMEGKQTNIKTIRNSFVELEETDDIEDILTQNKWQYIKDGNEYFVIGEDSLRVAKMFPGKVELRRPLQNGVFNKGEEKKVLVVSELVKQTIGRAPNNRSVVCTCISSPSVDGSPDSTYHKARLSGIFSNFGWNVKVIEEGMAVILAERPTVIDSDGKEVPYSGIAVSCLVPGTRIYTKRGIIPIEEVKKGDYVITHLGRWKPVNNIISKQFSGMKTKIQITGYTNKSDDYQFVDNHELYINRNGNWEWIGCENIIEGDIVGEPIIKQNRFDNLITMTLCERITCSNIYTKKHVVVTGDVQRLIGYFLGDGNISRLNNSGIIFNFNTNEEKYANDVKDIIKKNFGKESTIFIKKWKGSSKLCVECYSIGLGNYFRNHFYDSNKVKTYPWNIDKLTKSDSINLLIGLIRSDGNISNDYICFENTSSFLALLAKQLLSKLGYVSSISYTKPRSHILTDGRTIIGKKIFWKVSSASKTVSESLVDMVKNISCENSKFIEKIFIDDNFCCGKIKKIENEEYLGIVYDLQVEEDHSFSGPMLTIHNCGAGRVNCVLAYRGLQILGLSAARAGDFIDAKVAEQTDTPISQVISKEEKYLDFSNIDFDDDIIFALNAYYESMIEYVFNHFAKKFVEVKSEFDSPLDIIVAGGSAMPNGFCLKLSEVVRKLKLPFKIKDIRTAQDVRNSVVKGLLLSSIITQNKIEKDKTDDISKILGEK